MEICVSSSFFSEIIFKLATIRRRFTLLNLLPVPILVQIISTLLYISSLLFCTLYS